jgi:hypothetical protein
MGFVRPPPNRVLENLEISPGAPRVKIVTRLARVYTRSHGAHLIERVEGLDPCSVPMAAMLRSYLGDSGAVRRSSTAVARMHIRAHNVTPLCEGNGVKFAKRAGCGASIACSMFDCG